MASREVLGSYRGGSREVLGGYRGGPREVLIGGVLSRS